MYSENKWLQGSINWITVMGGIMMMLMMIHIVADVTGRVVFTHPFDGTTEIVSGYYMVAVIFFPLAYVTHNEGHIMVELFTRGMQPKRLAWLDAFITAVCLCLLIWFTWESFVEAWSSFLDNEEWETADDNITIWPSRWLLPIGLLAMAVYLGFRIVDYVRAAVNAR